VSEPAPPSAPEPRRDWRRHPALRRLPVLVLVVLGFGLWEWTKVPERELVWHLEGPGWRAVRELEFQVLGPGEELLKREQRFFDGSPPSPQALKVELRPGTYAVRVFARTAEGSLRPRVEQLALGEEPRLERTLYLAAGR
jgi:hypothetical protein